MYWQSSPAFRLGVVFFFFVLWWFFFWFSPFIRCALIDHQHFGIVKERSICASIEMCMVMRSVVRSLGDFICIDNDNLKLLSLYICMYR